MQVYLYIHITQNVSYYRCLMGIHLNLCRNFTKKLAKKLHKLPIIYYFVAIK